MVDIWAVVWLLLLAVVMVISALFARLV